MVEKVSRFATSIGMGSNKPKHKRRNRQKLINEEEEEDKPNDEKKIDEPENQNHDVDETMEIADF